MIISDRNNVYRSDNGRLSKIVKDAGDLSQRGETNKAVEELVSGLAIEPDNIDIYHFMTEILLDAKCFNEALETIGKVPAVHKDHIKTLILSAYCWEGLERYSEANEAAEEALRKEPDNALALNLKGILAYKKGDRVFAERCFEKAIQADESYGEPYTNLGTLRWTAQQREEGLELLERGFVLSPLATDIAAAYHAAINATGLFSRAEKVFQKALMVYPNSKRIAFLLIDMLLRLERYNAAMSEVERAMILLGIDDGILSAALDIRRRITPLEADKKTSGGGNLSLCMIVKNEAQHLAKCLMSVKPVVDEVIVVDTGSCDRTRDIATAFGAKVFEFPWTNDFSAARNASLAKASGDWILVLDADEVISPRDHAELTRLIAAAGQPVSYSFVTRNYIPQIHKVGWTANDGTYIEEAGAGWFGSSKVRLFPRDGRIQFINPVHELVEPSLDKAGIRIRECSIPIHHYGKLDQEKVNAKWEEYYLLGRKKLGAAGENADALRELAIQAGELKRFDEAIELWQRVISLRPRLTIAYINLASVYLQQNEFGPALAAARKARETSPGSNEAISNYALCEIYSGSLDHAMTALKGLLKKDPAYPPANIMLAIAYFCSGNMKDGQAVFNNLGISGAALAKCILPFADKLIHAGRKGHADILIDAANEADMRHPQ